MHSRATTEGVRPNARENSQIRPSTIVRAARAAGSHPHLASVLLQGLKGANIYASSGVIRGIPDYHGSNLQNYKINRSSFAPHLALRLHGGGNLKKGEVR